MLIFLILETPRNTLVSENLLKKCALVFIQFKKVLIWSRGSAGRARAHPPRRALHIRQLLARSSGERAKLASSSVTYATWREASSPCARTCKRLRFACSTWSTSTTTSSSRIWPMRTWERDAAVREDRPRPRRLQRRLHHGLSDSGKSTLASQYTRHYI